MKISDETMSAVKDLANHAFKVEHVSRMPDLVVSDRRVARIVDNSSLGGCRWFMFMCPFSEPHVAREDLGF